MQLSFRRANAGESTIAQIPDPMLQALKDLDLIDPHRVPEGTALTGGVSSSIWRIDLGNRTVCAKQALKKLNVAQDWYAPIERAAQEAEFNRFVHARWPDRVPRIIGFHAPTHTLISEYFPIEQYPIWKQQLQVGASQPAFAAKIADFLVALYRETEGSGMVRERFHAPHLIHALRLEPYFLATAKRHPELDLSLGKLVELFEANCVSLVHGDFSPKNILAGPEGPIILDAECANFGDPAFDAAFCLNHLCLKAVWVPEHAAIFKASAQAFLKAYAAGGLPPDLFRRLAAYLPGLMLARIDGKSPVEYIKSDSETELVRHHAIGQLLLGKNDPCEMIDDWFSAVIRVRQESA